MKNLIMQSISEIAKNPTVATSVPIIAAGTGWATFEHWLPLVTGATAAIFGAIASVVIVRINWTQHKIKMEILKRDLAECKKRDGRHDRRDDNQP